MISGTGFMVSGTGFRISDTGFRSIISKLECHNEEEREGVCSATRKSSRPCRAHNLSTGGGGPRNLLGLELALEFLLLLDCLLHLRLEFEPLRLFPVSGISVSGIGFRVSGFGFRVSGSGFRVSGLGFRVLGSGIMVVKSRVYVEESGETAAPPLT